MIKPKFRDEFSGCSTLFSIVMVDIERKWVCDVGELSALIELGNVLRGEFERLVVNHRVWLSFLLFPKEKLVLGPP